MREFTFHGADGTELIGWTNDGTGPRVLLCNGLAAPAQSWPGLLDRDSGFEVLSWHQRGFFGSQRPSSEQDARLDVHVRDAVALLDHMNWDRAIVLGWSFGVNMAAQLALDSPERLCGLVAVAGLPGGTFSALLGRNPLPPVLRHAIGRTGTAFGESQAWGINRLASMVPSPVPVARAMLRTGFVNSRADVEEVAAMVGPYLSHEFGWYFTTARIMAAHAPLDVSGIDVPAEVLVGSRDAVTDPRAVERFGRALPDAEVRILPGTHFLPLEHPQEIAAALQRVHERTRCHQLARR